MDISSNVRIGPFEVFFPLNSNAPAIKDSKKESNADEYPGRLFIVEGIDGSGKSTQLSLLHVYTSLWMVLEPDHHYLDTPVRIPTCNSFCFSGF